MMTMVPGQSVRFGVYARYQTKPQAGSWKVSKPMVSPVSRLVYSAQAGIQTVFSASQKLKTALSVRPPALRRIQRI